MEFYQGDTYEKSFKLEDPDGLNLFFTSIDTYEQTAPTIGEEVEGMTSHATATVVDVIVLEGNWSTNDVIGKIYITDKEGNFQAEESIAQEENIVGLVQGEASSYMNLTGYNILVAGKADPSDEDLNSRFLLSNFDHPNYFNKISPYNDLTVGEIIIEMDFEENGGGTGLSAGKYTYEIMAYYENKRDEVSDRKVLHTGKVTSKQDVTRGI